MGTVLFTALGISCAAIGIHGAFRQPDDLFTDEAEVSFAAPCTRHTWLASSACFWDHKLADEQPCCQLCMYGQDMPNCMVIEYALFWPMMFACLNTIVCPWDALVCAAVSNALAIQSVAQDCVQLLQIYSFYFALCDALKCLRRGVFY